MNSENIREAVIPGSFDPPTKGHLNIIKRAAHTFDKVTVLIAQNNEKRYLFSVDERLSMMRASVSDIPNVVVVDWSGLTVDYMKNHKIRHIVRGIRNTIDFEIENQLALINKNLYIDCETFFLPADPVLLAVSSSVVRDLLKHNSDISSIVPEEVVKIIKK
jgi:pantetheine-phosphate adenylyltransferase